MRLVSLPLFFFFFFFSPPPVTGLPSRSGHRRGVARSGLVYNCIIYSAIWPTVNLYNFPVAVYVNSTNPLCRLAHRAAFEYRGQQRGRLFPPGAAPGGLFREISHRWPFLSSAVWSFYWPTLSCSTCRVWPSGSTTRDDFIRTTNKLLLFWLRLLWSITSRSVVREKLHVRSFGRKFQLRLRFFLLSSHGFPTGPISLKFANRLVSDGNL